MKRPRARSANPAVLIASAIALASMPAAASLNQPYMQTDAANAVLPNARANLGLGGFGMANEATMSCTTASGSPSVSGCNTTTGLQIGDTVSGPGIANGTTVTAIPASINPTSFTLSQAAGWGAGSGTIVATGPVLTALNLSGSTESVSPTTGALTAIGGIGTEDRINAGANGAWAESLVPGSINATQIAGVSKYGEISLSGVTRTSDYGAQFGTPATGTIGVLGLGVNDDTAHAANALGADLIGWNTATATGAYTAALELDLHNLGAVVDVTPYIPYPNGRTIGLNISSGFGGTPHNASAAITIGTNPAKWRKGIVFQSTGLDTALGAGGNGVAMEMASGQSLRWMNSSASIIDEVWADATGHHVAAPLYVTGATVDVGNTAATLFIHSPGQDNGIFITPENGSWGEIAATNNANSGSKMLVVNRWGGHVVLGGSSTPTDCGQELCVTGGLNVSANGVTLPVYTVATLPACAAGNKNTMAAVSDATAPTYNGALTGGGTVDIPVFCNGTSWTAH